jgi:hypothetical protein
MTATGRAAFHLSRLRREAWRGPLPEPEDPAGGMVAGFHRPGGWLRDAAQRVRGLDIRRDGKWCCRCPARVRSGWDIGRDAAVACPAGVGIAARLYIYRPAGAPRTGTAGFRQCR